MVAVAERGKYYYSYVESRTTSFLKNFCNCCLKHTACFKHRMQRLERHKKALEMLEDEVDICKFIYILRIGKFLSKLVLKKHQRALVTNFKKYQLKNLDHQVKREKDEQS